jgi:hypothetical protein
MFGLRLRHFLFTLPQGVAAVPKWSQHHKNHQTPRPCTSTREFDVSLDCVWLSGLALSCPKKVRAGRVSTIFLCSSACHARATTCAHPNNPGQRSLSPLDGVSKPKSDLGAVLKDHFFGGASHDSLVSDLHKKSRRFTALSQLFKCHRDQHHVSCEKHHCTLFS